jgi:cytochrome oxidase Cu insertion factor (SCO1/SenC/PrrC family)
MRWRDVSGLTAFALVALITVAWWGLALWPLGNDAPAWLARTQYVCFGTQPDGLPDASGWLALILQPALMLGILGVITGETVLRRLRALARTGAGRAMLAGVAAAVLVGIGAAGKRVVTAGRWNPAVTALGSADPAVYERLDRPAPGLRLTDQHGETLTLERFVGRPVLLTFAFGHCETVCPAVVHDVRAAVERLADIAPAVLVVTLDPWRDVPSRLPSIAQQWNLAGEAFVLGGSVEAVEDVLDRWSVPRSRDPSTGDIIHPRLVYIIDSHGKLVYVTSGGADTVAGLLRRL